MEAMLEPVRVVIEDVSKVIDGIRVADAIIKERSE